MRNQRRNQKRAATSGEKETAGPLWYNIPASDPTKSLDVQNDVRMLHLRNSIDPKLHYKKNISMGKFFQIGKIIEDPTEFYSRITSKEKRRGIVDSLLDDKETRRYYKKKYQQIQTTLKRRDKRFKRNNHKR